MASRWGTQEEILKKAWTRAQGVGVLGTEQLFEHGRTH